MTVELRAATVGGSSDDRWKAKTFFYFAVTTVERHSMTAGSQIQHGQVLWQLPGTESLTSSPTPATWRSVYCSIPPVWHLKIALPMVCISMADWGTSAHSDRAMLSLKESSSQRAGQSSCIWRITRCFWTCNILQSAALSRTHLMSAFVPCSWCILITAPVSQELQSRSRGLLT